MALHDGDPNTTNRIEPNPQAPDQHLVRQSDGTHGITNKKDTSSGAYASVKDGALRIYDGSNVVIVVGVLPDGSFGHVEAKAGYGVQDVFG